MRGTIVVAVLVTTIAGMSGPFADSARPAPRPGEAAAERALGTALHDRTPAATPRARCRPSARAWSCRWSQTTRADGWVYECDGKARLKRGRWRIDPCELAATSAPFHEAHDLIFGFNDDWGEHTGRIDYAKDVGGEVIRFPLGWNIVQPTFGPSNLLEALLDPEGSWDWSYYDHLYKAARAQGVRIVLSLQDAPCWAYQEKDECTEDAGGSAPDAEHLDEMAIFLQEALRRYPDAVAVEMYNEPNLSPYWQGRPDPEYYAELLAAGYEATKSVRPDMPVLFGGLAPVRETNDVKMNFEEFFGRALDAGAAGKFDALSAHPYFRPFMARDYIDRMGRHLAALKTIAFERGDPGMRLWITEVGISTAGDGAVTEADQAERTAQLYSATRRIPGVDALILHRMFDTKGTGTNENGWGLVRSDMGVKPAYCEIAVLNERAPSRCAS